MGHAVSQLKCALNLPKPKSLTASSLHDLMKGSEHKKMASTLQTTCGQSGT